MSVQRVNILLRDGAETGTAPTPALPGTNTATEGPWDLAVVADGRYQDQPLSLGVWDSALDRVAAAELDVVRATNDIVVTVPAEVFDGLDPATAGYQISMLSNAEPTEGIGLVRPVYSLEHWSELGNREFRFGGGAGEQTGDLPSRDTDTRDPNTIDVVTGERPQAEVLDWTGSSPVVLPFLPFRTWPAEGWPTRRPGHLYSGARAAPCVSASRRTGRSLRTISRIPFGQPFRQSPDSSATQATSRISPSGSTATVHHDA